MSWVTTSFIVPHEEVCVCVGKGFFGFNHKIMIKIQEPMVCESLGKALVVQGKYASALVLLT